MKKARKFRAMDTAKSEIGKRIKEAIRKARIAQKVLAASVGVAESTITGYISGRNEPSFATLLKIAEITNVSTDWLLTGKESHANDPGEHYQVTQIHRGLTPEEEAVLSILKEDPDVAAMWKMFLSMPESERRDAAEVYEMYHHLPRSQRMRRKADILEDIEKLEKEKGGGLE